MLYDLCSLQKLLYTERTKNGGGDSYNHFDYHFPAGYINFTHHVMSLLVFVVKVDID